MQCVCAASTRISMLSIHLMQKENVGLELIQCDHVEYSDQTRLIQVPLKFRCAHILDCCLSNDATQ